MLYSVYPTADHDSWTATDYNPEVYQWLPRQNPSASSAAPSGMNFKGIGVESR